MTADNGEEGILLEINTAEAPARIPVTSKNWSLIVRNRTGQDAETANVIELVGFMLMAALGILQDTQSSDESCTETFHSIAASVTNDMKPMYTAEDLMAPPDPPTSEAPDVDDPAQPG